MIKKSITNLPLSTSNHSRNSSNDNPRPNKLLAWALPRQTKQEKCFEKSAASAPLSSIGHMAMALRLTLFGATTSGMVPPITDAELIAFLNSLDVSPERRELIRVSLSLVGRVPYFWGGKSAAGWNDAWNTPRLVTAPGSRSSGTVRPFGLDCTGFTDWVYRTALGIDLGGGGTWSQWERSTAITSSELQPGDLGFFARPGAIPINHVLIFAGWDANGVKLWIHSSSSGGGVVMNSTTAVRYFRRVIGVDAENMSMMPVA